MNKSYALLLILPFTFIIQKLTVRSNIAKVLCDIWLSINMIMSSKYCITTMLILWTLHRPENSVNSPKIIYRVYQGMSIISGVLQSKLQSLTHLWGVPGCANHQWGPPIKITGSNTSVGCTRVCQSSVRSSNQNYSLQHICGVCQGVPIICGVPPIEIRGSNTSVGCARVCQSSVGSSNQN